MKSPLIKKNVLKYVQNTPNILFDNQIFFVSQTTHHFITINNYIGIIYAEPTENTLLFVLDCLANNVYYNLIYIFKVALSYLEKVSNSFYDKYKNKLYQITEAITHQNPYLSYYLYNLDKYFNNKDNSCYYKLTKDYKDIVVNKNNILNVLNTTLLDIYFTSEEKIKLSYVKLIIEPSVCEKLITILWTSKMDEITNELHKYSKDRTIKISEDKFEIISSNKKFKNLFY